MSSVNNPRFPHKVIITRAEKDSSGVPITDDNGDDIYDTIIESECGLRTTSEADINSGIAQTDIKISLPIPFPMVIVKINDVVDFVNGINGEEIKGKVTTPKQNNLGLDIFFHVDG